MSNSPLPISNLPNVQSTGLTPSDLLVIVNYDVPSGTTKNITTDEFKTYINSGITNSFTGGTVSGSTEFTDGLTANTLNVNGVNITGDYLPLSGGVMDDNAIIQFDNASQLREGVYDFGGQGGISQICGVGYENNWQSGINHIFDSNGFIRESSHCFNIIPDNTFDSSLRFKVGSRWVLDNGDIYVCSDDNVGVAVWDLEINDTYVTGGTYFSGGTIVFDYNIGGTFQVTGLTEDLNNEIAGLAEADEETIELNLTTNKIQLKEIVAEATGGTRTFQGDFAISGGTLNLDTIGSGSPIINLGLDSSGEVVTGTTDQTVTITGGTNIEVVGSYPDFGINFTGDTFTGLTVGVTQITSGTSGSILFEGSGNVLQESTSLVWDNTNSTLGIGASPSSATTLDVRSKDVLTTSIPFRVRNNANTVNFLTVNNYGEVFSNGLVGTTSNTFFGEGNGRSITTGGSNTSFGYNTFFSNNTGAGNSVFGTSSLLNNLSGSFNSAFGSNALQVNIIGNNNSAFGSNALLNNTNSDNSAFGFDALKNNTTGQKNTAVGQGSLVANISGINNTAVGANSLQSNTIGIENTSIGRNSLFSSITGSSNTSIGVNSLAHITIGGSNIALGNDAGRRKSDNSTLIDTTSSIFIGVNTRASGETQTNQIVIGTSAIGLGSNTTVIGNSSTTLFRPYGNVLVDGALSATTVSATTYQNLPVSGLTEGSNISLTNNSGNYTVAVTGITNPINSYFSAGSGTTVNWDVSGQSTNYDITLTATTTLNLSNVRNGEYGTIIVRQDGVGGRTITLGTINGPGGDHRVANGGGGSIILTSNASAIDILTFTYNGSIMFWTVGNDYT
jgi:hypothetical protein